MPHVGGCVRRMGENEILDDIDFDRYGKVKCSKIEGMLPKLMKMVEGGDEKFFSAAKSLSTGTTRKVAMVSQHTGQGLYEQVVNETLWKIIKRTIRRNV